jgi:hypothetical protein
MRSSPKAGVLVSLLLFVLISVAAAAADRDNAAITGDGVRLSAEPSTASLVLESLKKGTRVDVRARTDIRATVDGYTADWFIVRHGGNVGFVFGRYIRLDPGVVVPVEATGPQDPVGRLVSSALGAFGRTEAEIVATLGRPLTVSEQTFPNRHWPGKTDATRELRYVGLVVGIYRVYDGKAFVYSITVTDTRYRFDGIGVGDPISAINRILGPPGSVEGDALTYYDQETGYYYATFTVTGGVVREIRFIAVPD